uniref:Uncharacterized protein n=1 Tax=Pseudictyota dubia TaxID=2749911 RepID=A0A7R9WIC7_9STRA|mmetsp:Transcript_49932/g.92365  ORF Transcript_49932/g.92365 Transcript_49932/m.92365 type:complete len:124 (+) Transcript_49932:1-372(+)
MVPAGAKCGSRGGPRGGQNPRKGFGAPLADPYAQPDPTVVPHVDAALRVVCAALNEEDSATDAEHVAGLNGQEVRDAVPAKQVDGVKASLAYLRDRVGVPRDMPLAAARQFRAHLNWAIDVLE